MTELKRVFFTFAEVAEMTALKESWLRRAAAAQAIPSHKVGRHIRFTEEDIDALIAQSARPIVPPPPGLRRARISARA
jgi:excisionase family DNA binding protein